jgi:hypothetical protein
MVLRIIPRVLARVHGLFNGWFKPMPFGISQTGLQISRAPILYSMLIELFKGLKG